MCASAGGGWAQDGMAASVRSDRPGAVRTAEWWSSGYDLCSVLRGCGAGIRAAGQVSTLGKRGDDYRPSASLEHRRRPRENSIPLHCRAQRVRLAALRLTVSRRVLGAGWGGDAGFVGGLKAGEHGLGAVRPGETEVVLA